MKNIYTTTLRLNLDNEDDRQAYEYLRRLDKQEYRSYSKAIVAAINAFYDRKEALEDDSYLESRVKEDAFLQKITETIEAGMRAAAWNPTNFGAIFQMMQGAAADTPVVKESEVDEEDISAALDFADSF